MIATKVKARRRIKQSYYFFYKTKDGGVSAIERYGSRERVAEVIERIKQRKVIIDRVYISNSQDFIKFLNRKPAISLNKLALECKMQPKTMYKLTDGSLNVTVLYAELLAPVINSYGYLTSEADLLRNTTNDTKKAKK